MKVLVLNNAAPFVRGGAEALADNLVRHLNETPGVEAELARIPFSWEPEERLIEEMLLSRSLRLTNVDRVIGLKFPAYLIQNPHKTLWILHQFRQAYDLYEPGGGYLDGERGLKIRGAVAAADNACFGECRRIYCNSPVTQARLRDHNHIEAEVLYPPLNDPELFTGGPQGDYIFAGGRVAPGKRQHLLIEAMAQAPGAARLVIAGPEEDEAYTARLRALIAQHGLEARVELAVGFHPRERIAAWVNGARACAYLPYQEDSLGYVTMEAFAARRPMLTLSDAGGLLEMVDEETGAVVAPDPAAIAEGLERLSDPLAARLRGEAAGAVWDDFGLTWKDTVSALLQG